LDDRTPNINGARAANLHLDPVGGAAAICSSLQCWHAFRGSLAERALADVAAFCLPRLPCGTEPRMWLRAFHRAPVELVLDRARCRNAAWG